MKIAVIPARGGSKRIIKKNIKHFCGKPMIAWSILTAKSAGIFDSIIVSTDDEEIAEIAKFYGASVPFRRPLSLSGDHSSTMEVIEHAVSWHLSNGVNLNFICCLYATAPFVRETDLKDGYETLLREGADFAFPISTYDYPIQRALRLRSDGRIEMYEPENFALRSQDLTEAYHDAGQFYWGTKSGWLSGAPILSPKSAPLFIPRYRVQDIDTEEDWIQAEKLFKILGYHIEN
ncbi:pseudaminic acid cytidylyltransferase [Planktomarina temperata]|nr:pseudaminic acid cytidylyltransferase [Planktomarina temperata]